MLYEIAFALHQPLSTVLDMPHDELQGWIAYFNESPLGWREDDRTFKLLQAQGYKGAPDALFPSLRKRAEEPLEDGQISVRNLTQSSFFSKMLGAQGGDKIEYDKDTGVIRISEIAESTKG